MIGSRILSIVFNDAKMVSATYMAFIQGGGIFIPTDTSFQLGEKLIALIDLPGNSESQLVTGIVVWIDSAKAEKSGSRGVGIQLQESDSKVRLMIESCIASLASSKKGSTGLLFAN